MAASLRELRERNRSVRATQKITRAMELIAASRITKAQQAAQEALPYTRALNRAVRDVLGHAGVYHPLLIKAPHPRRSAVLVLASDRGLSGAYSSNVLRKAEELFRNLDDKHSERQLYVCGRKAVDYYKYRSRPMADHWEGFSDHPSYADADLIAHVLMEAFLRPYEDGGVDEINIVHTRFVSMLAQETRVRRLLPLEVVEAGGAGRVEALYDFEADTDGTADDAADDAAYGLLDELLSLYVRNRIHFYLMQAAASELASKQRAMKAATDNAQQLIEDLTRQANQARQSQITQEITEIVGGAQALSEVKTRME
ncbi:MAG: F0F1 ATP synthase subunit gamma [Propionibacteriaceae bacterium]|jgi:F-type H+-transporting ATPase subunit gamma|nr:F0F1 ATP synthase subunit gamma [Propionibacteriaceae bacterium]